MEKLKRWLVIVVWSSVFAWSVSAVSAQVGAPAASAQTGNAAPTAAPSIAPAAPSAATVQTAVLTLGPADHILIVRPTARPVSTGTNAPPLKPAAQATPTASIQSSSAAPAAVPSVATAALPAATVQTAVLTLGPADHILYVRPTARPVPAVVGTPLPAPAAQATAAAPAQARSGAPTSATPPVAGVQAAMLTVRPIAHPDDTTIGQRLFSESLDGSRLDPANWTLHVFKSRHRVELYYKDQLFRIYHAVFGRSGLTGGKEWAGDARTPEGKYLIIDKWRSARFRWFLKLNYPNGMDEARFNELRANDEIPAWKREGSLVGIHGTDSPMLNIENVNWTLGCISVDNADIKEMAALLPVGTLVVINP